MLDTAGVSILFLTIATEIRLMKLYTRYCMGSNLYRIAFNSFLTKVENEILHIILSKMSLDNASTRIICFKRKLSVFKKSIMGAWTM